MERNIDKSASDSKTESKSSIPKEKKKSDEDEIESAKNEVNSWDCSTPSPNEKFSKEKASNWDSSSECHETIVEPFDSKSKDCCNWDSDGGNHCVPNFSFERKKGVQNFAESSDSLDLSIADLSDLDKNSLVDTFNSISCEQRKSANISERSVSKSEDDLLVEDLEEFVKDEERPKLKMSEEKPNRFNETETRSEKVRSNRSEGTPEDTTIWMIPKSERTQSADSSSKLILSSDREKIKKLSDLNISLKKAKSFSDMQKNKRKLIRSSHSDCLGSFDLIKNSLTNTLLSCEGTSLQRKLKTNFKNEGISGCKNFDRTRVFFTEYDCRTMTMDKDVPTKLSVTSRTHDERSEEILTEASVDTPDENTEINTENRPSDGTRNSEAAIRGLVHPGPSTAASMDVVSLPDMTGKNSIKERSAKEKIIRRLTSRNECSESTPQESAETNQLSESWLLLDGTGQYQAVTRNEVTILLNGRSADAVLQGRKEHFVPSSTLGDSFSPSGSITGVITKESLRNILREEDIGGEDNPKKIFDLERKMENTLLYIQPGMNLTASIKIIPVDNEMVHIWRRTRDNGSLLSSEVDLRYHSSQDLIEHNGQRTSPVPPLNSPRRLTLENPQQTVAEQDETLPQEVSAEETQVKLKLSDPPNADYSNLLIETRMIVDSLTNNFKTLQSRLDGETNRSLALQGEVNKLRHLLKNIGGRYIEKNSRETICDQQLLQSDVSSSVSLLTVKAVNDKTDMVSESIIEEGCEESVVENSTEIHQEILECVPAPQEKLENSLIDSGCITVNIYTVDDPSNTDCVVKVQETNSLLQTNLGMIEGKMKRLQEENEIVMKQNHDLKRKLKEISLELEKYLAGTSVGENSLDEDLEMEALRDQVCNLKLELDTLKTTAWSNEEHLKTENSLMREGLAENLLTVEEWFEIAAQIIKEINDKKYTLKKHGIELNDNVSLERIAEPKDFLKCVNLYLEQTTEHLVTSHNEKVTLEEMVKKSSHDTSKELAGLDLVISGYAELIEQSRKNSGDAGNQVMEDYFTVIMEKASLMEELKILKTENEMLLESQVEHYEKLKQTMIALKDRKSEIIALESSNKLSEEEKSKMADLIKTYEEEKRLMKDEISAKSTEMEEIIMNMRNKESEMKIVREELEVLTNEIKQWECSCRKKDALIDDSKMEIDRLINSERIKSEQIEILSNKLNHLELQKTQLETELSAVKVFSSETQKEMSEYITHLETVVNNTQEILDKTKQKLKESNQTTAKLKNDNDALDRQHHCDVKLYNKTKEELEACKGKLVKLRETEKEINQLCKNFEIVEKSEKEKTEALEAVAREYKMLLAENCALKEKTEAYSKEKDESLKEQKDLINKYAILSKEFQKLQGKYKNVKVECNERTNLIKYLEMMLKENLHEYNGRIACLESSISHIIEKIAACKSCMKEKNFGVDAEVTELRHQLSVTAKERKELEQIVSNYYSMMKHLEKEIEEREKKVDELHMKLSFEQERAMELENNKKLFRNEQDPSLKSLKIEKLEEKIAVTEKELMECKKQLQNCQSSYESEKKKLELTIADLKFEISKYQLRIEVMMKNLRHSNKNINEFSCEKRNTNTGNLQFLKKELEEKDKRIEELCVVVQKFKAEIKAKDSDLENSKKKIVFLKEEMKVLKDQFMELRHTLSAKTKNSEISQKEKNEMAEKLLQSVKLVMEERSARQAVEVLAAEKEKSSKEQLEQMKNELLKMGKELKISSEALEEKKKILTKHQEELKRMKSENNFLKAQMNACKIQHYNKGSGDHFNLTNEPRLSDSVKQSQVSNISSEKFESCMKELKEIRDVNLQLRKMEGQYEAKIVRLEDEIREARLLIKELEGDVKTERKSKKALKDMITCAKMEIEKCLLAKQIMSVVADKISRHLDLSDTSSKELFSCFRLNQNGSFNHIINSDKP